MLTPEEIEFYLNKILPAVNKPGRYTGGELNQVVKNWPRIKTKVALVFPDIYDIGMSNLGIAILYDLINSRADTLAERVFAPWVDMEILLRENHIPIYSLETKHPLADFDLIGFSLPYETLYTNTLNMLHLAQLPLLSKDRDNTFPLIIAGGQATYNPEPMHAFIDAFVIGEGEEVIQEIINTHQDWKASKFNKDTLLISLSSIPGVYVPSLYDVDYHSDQTISKIYPITELAPLPITKRIVSKLPPPPDKLIVPYIDIVHNRIPIEIMRGCTRGCRFCHAGIVNRPVRERSIEAIIKAIDNALLNTGYEEIGLLSLSSSDYSQITKLVASLSERYCNENLSISLPSLRIETLSVDLMNQLQTARRGGFTLAPEAATDKLRNIINKPISSQDLIITAGEIFKRGWLNIKLYFMIGHPKEDLDDIHAIIQLCQAVLAEGRKFIGYKAKVHVGVSTFIPKAHTPFQWAITDTREKIEQKHELLKRELRRKGFKFTWVAPEATMLESILSRGDRRLSDVIYRAWKNGSKFDAWNDKLDLNIWLDCFEQAQINPNFYTTRQRSLVEVFPWDHINIGVSKNFLINDYKWSMQGKTRNDCREHCYACGILTEFSSLRNDYPDSNWQCPEVKSGELDEQHILIDNK